MTLSAGKWPVKGRTGQYSETASTGTAPTNGNTNFQAFSDNVYAQRKVCDGLTFTPQGATLTCTVAGAYLIRFELSVFGIFSNGFLGGAVDLNGDIEGSDFSTAEGNCSAAPNVVWAINAAYGLLVVERLVDLVPGQIVKPLVAFTTGAGGAGEAAVVDHFQMIAEPKGEAP